VNVLKKWVNRLTLVKWIKEQRDRQVKDYGYLCKQMDRKIGNWMEWV
jgi:hypothetical protein